MSVEIPATHLDLLQRPICVTLCTLMEDNQPQATIVWFSYDGERIWINTAAGRAKYRNMLERPQVTIVSVDPENSYRFLEVRGKVTEVTEEGGVDHINLLSGRYFGREDYYANNPEQRNLETRVIFKITPTRAIGY